VGEWNSLQSTHGHNAATASVSQHEIGALCPAQQGLGLNRQETISPLLRSTSTLECL
jgi:hypothetical protein